MSMRQARCLRRSADFLIPVGPFMDKWGKTLGESRELTPEEKGEIIICLFEGYKRQDMAFGYTRAYGALIQTLPRGIDSLEAHIAFDVVAEIKKSPFTRIAELSQEEFEGQFKTNLEEFECELTGMKF
jgi:hypothetical protein